MSLFSKIRANSVLIFRLLFFIAITICCSFVVRYAIHKTHHGTPAAYPDDQADFPECPLAPDKPRYSIVIETGAREASVHVYSYSKNEQNKKIILHGEESLSTAQNLLSIKDPKKAAKSIQPLIDFAKKHIPKENMNTCTSVVFKATSEIRSLGVEKSKDFLQAVLKLLSKTPFYIDQESAEIMDAKDEGPLTWLAVNFLLGNLEGKKSENLGESEVLGEKETEKLPEEKAQNSGEKFAEKLTQKNPQASKLSSFFPTLPFSFTQTKPKSFSYNSQEPLTENPESPTPDDSPSNSNPTPALFPSSSIQSPQTAGIVTITETSSEIVFTPNPAISKEYSYIPDVNTSLISYFENEYNLYQHSFLSLGISTARKDLKRYLAKNFNSTVVDEIQQIPCLPPGYVEEIEAEGFHIVVDEKTKKPQEKIINAVVQGASEFYGFDKCLPHVVDFLTHTRSCPSNSCDIHGEHRPTLEHSFTVNWYLTSNFYAIVSDYMEENGKKSLKLNDYKKVAMQACSVEIDENPNRCIDATFLYALLAFGYEISGEQDLFPRSEIGGVELHWALGAMLQQIV